MNLSAVVLAAAAAVAAAAVAYALALTALDHWRATRTPDAPLLLTGTEVPFRVPPGAPTDVPRTFTVVQIGADRTGWTVTLHAPTGCTCHPLDLGPRCPACVAAATREDAHR